MQHLDLAEAVANCHLPGPGGQCGLLGREACRDPCVEGDEVGVLARVRLPRTRDAAHVLADGLPQVVEHLGAARCAVGAHNPQGEGARAVDFAGDPFEKPGEVCVLARAIPVDVAGDRSFLGFRPQEIHDLLVPVGAADAVEGGPQLGELLGERLDVGAQHAVVEEVEAARTGGERESRGEGAE
ncbi:hypothetical protein [Nocardia cyriacigeorgica]|uniref:hypothetical protein n=1 Tax=Nocardia cyriacigeorgica TaxID=135487 RepID=UPI001E5FB1B8|nr:hypothetical protein [Nocardia cyriacigeorgica]